MLMAWDKFYFRMMQRRINELESELGKKRIWKLMFLIRKKFDQLEPNCNIVVLLKTKISLESMAIMASKWGQKY